MARFECDWCGKCCRSFGEFIRVERQVSERDYFCRYGITNELFPVHVLPEFSEEVEEDFESRAAGQNLSPSPCLFLRKNPAGKGFACAVYPTRPTICRQFTCYRMLIHHAVSGEIRGRVIGLGELRTADEALRALWAEKIAGLPHPVAQHNAVMHSHAPGTKAAHGHDPHLHAHLHGSAPAGDAAWVASVLAVLAAHGYRGDPVE